MPSIGLQREKEDVEVPLFDLQRLLMQQTSSLKQM